MASRRERLSHLLNSQNYEYEINILWFYHLHWVLIWLILIVFFRFWRFTWIIRDGKMRGVTAMDITLLEEFKFRWMGTQGNHCYCTTMQSLQNFQGQLLLLRHHAIPADINYFYKYSTTIFIQTTTTSTSTSTSTSTTSTLQLPRTTSKTNYYCFNKIILDLGMTTHTHFFCVIFLHFHAQHFKVGDIKLLLEYINFILYCRASYFVCAWLLRTTQLSRLGFVHIWTK